MLSVLHPIYECFRILNSKALFQIVVTYSLCFLFYEVRDAYGVIVFICMTSLTDTETLTDYQETWCEYHVTTGYSF